MLDFGLYLTYAMVAIAALSFIGFEVYHMAKNIADAKVTLAGIGVLVVVVLISYAMGSGDFTYPGIDKFDMQPGSLKMIDAGLYTTYFMMLVAVLALLADLVMSFGKK